MLSTSFFALLCAALSTAHYTFPSINSGAAWVNVRQTNNYNTRNPVTDVTSADIRCYTSETNAGATTLEVAAGSTVTYHTDGTIYHPGVLNVYMAKAPSSAAGWAGDGNVWFKVYEISAVTDGGKTISWPSEGLASVPFTIPKNLPSGEYLIRIEHIALHVAQSFGGAQFYLSCAQVKVTGGGSGSPGPLVAFPGAYTGNEPGILININYPIPANYTQPGPAVWSG